MDGMVQNKDKSPQMSKMSQIKNGSLMEMIIIK